MSKSYFVQIGGLKQISNVSSVKYFLYNIIHFGKRLFLYSSSFLVTLVITLYVFCNCITPNTSHQRTIIALSDCISLGSIFATFGSAIIAVLSLYSAQQLSSFEEKLEILNGEFTKNGISNWKRWEFIPRYSKQQIYHKKSEFFILENASLYFTIEQKRLQIPIPTTRKDFNDLPIVYNRMNLYRYKRSYLNYVFKNNCLEDLLIWDCLSSMYSNIILYRLSQFAVWIGTAFVINSILYAFFYTQFYTMI